MLGCDTFGGLEPGRGPVISNVDITPAGALEPGDTVTIMAGWTSGEPPFTLTVNTGGGGAAEPAPVTTADITAQTSFVLGSVNGEYNLTATVTDSLAHSDNLTVSYTIGPPENSPPVVSVTSASGSFTAGVTDPDGDNVIVEIAEISGGTTEPSSQVVSGGSGSAVFTVSANDLFAGGTVSGTVTASDGERTSAPVPFSVTAPSIGPSLVDTLYAIPLQSTAAPGEPVTIVVATGAMPSPFLFMEGVRVTGPPGFEYIDNSFNAGAPGGGPEDVDGIWSATGATALNLSDPDDQFLFGTLRTGLEPDATGQAGRWGWDFLIHPVGGTELVDASGILFNFQATFAPGVNVLSFQQFQGVTRTWYNGSDRTQGHQWGDIDNGGVPNSVTVN
jgi:hypothetical protein